MNQGDDGQQRPRPEEDLLVERHCIEFDCGEPELRHARIGTERGLVVFGQAELAVQRIRNNVWRDWLAVLEAINPLGGGVDVSRAGVQLLADK